MKALLRCWSLWLIASAGGLSAQVGGVPHMGYVYPAGAQTGTEVEVIVGGKNLRGVRVVMVSGEGVRATVGEHLNNYKRTYGDALREKQGEMRGGNAGNTENPKKAGKTGIKKASVDEEMPDFPIFRSLDDLSPAELRTVTKNYRNKVNVQKNREIDELLSIRIQVSPDAVPGEIDLRLLSPNGLSNSLKFQVGTLPEVLEAEPNDQFDKKATVLQLPCVINGQILAGDLDRFRFLGEEGRNVVIAVSARQLIPFLADAVPGWFQATITLYDAKGREVAFADDYRFSPDPVLFYTIPEDGVYDLEIKDAIYRGREDFVYRIQVGEIPFVTSMFPLGCQVGSDYFAAISGWNLNEKTVKIPSSTGVRGIGTGVIRMGSMATNSLRWAVGDASEMLETEDGKPGESQMVALNQTINGRIAKPGEKDSYRIELKKGEPLCIEVMARRLHSPMDALIRVLDGNNQLLAWADDTSGTNIGVEVHQADPILSFSAPEDGIYLIQVSDAQGQGGAEFGYRLHIRPINPGFDLYLSPSGINIPAGGSIAVSVHLVRKDGFAGPIDLELSKAPHWLKLTGGRVPSGVNQIRVTLSTTQEATPGPHLLSLVGTAVQGDQKWKVKAIPADYRMQAFLYRHLTVAAQNLFFVRRMGKEAPFFRLEKAGVLQQWQAGQRYAFRVKTRPDKRIEKLELELSEAPAGFSIEDFKTDGNRLSFAIQLDAEVKDPMEGNLILEVFGTMQRGDKGIPQRVSLGNIEAIPFELNRQEPES